MSGSRAIPQPGTARLVTARPGCGGRYWATDQATESPKNAIRGSAPGLRSGRCMGSGRRLGTANGMSGGALGTGSTTALAAGGTVASTMTAPANTAASTAVAPATTA